MKQVAIRTKIEVVANLRNGENRVVPAEQAALAIFAEDPDAFRGPDINAVAGRGQRRRGAPGDSFGVRRIADVNHAIAAGNPERVRAIRRRIE